ncbi:hypothetical protein Kpol_1003p38 [Vanderwaltozyma polyspora DSM 70294]|uniref:SAM-dependent MTase RsmB/NOP-type domain-containing protein n=1 Tax=Vanderwaltozyma polyspora (strain ATCC 22028 / DSM 70294 / BCRC 21397 / CBS 2163 / NBRC 10782 / NRRL Y-8283 / UCD 57-17) TaxID=436907 RepID=A7TLZ6_VANPO|nr:uncharacterized protein Kpol_1003p38 [Vanderwaltozyma polyspora DSM 70294]EDO16733.1 hypothetical protein Kpol_1003p38 [Vanderwaltozyma polyspora DSM 70294]
MDFYRDSTWVLEYLEKENAKDKISGSLQGLVLKSCKKYKVKSNPRHVYAAVSSCWKVKPYLEKVMKRSGILDDIPNKKGKPQFERLTLLLLCHDLLLSKSKRIQMGKHPIKTYILKYKTRLHSELVKLKLKLKVRDLSELIEDENSNDDITPVRWIRINPIRAQYDKGLEPIMNELNKKFPTRVNHWSDIVPGTIYHDDYIPNLFGVHTKDKITSHELYKTGKVIIQDRASCFPAHILNPGKNDIVIDACAAPGNKTTHTASYILGGPKKDQTTQIYAFEKDPERAKILQHMIKVAGCSNTIQVNVGDFTKIATPEKFRNVTGFIVDPSCSGSGIFGRKYVDSINKKKQESSGDNGNQDDEDAVPDEQEEEFDLKRDDLKTRLSKLASFQFQVVKHAMSFPKAKKIVYSTCSIHAEENEGVVIDLLLDKKVQEWGWKVAPRSEVIPTWPRRGFQAEFSKVFRDEDEKCQELADGCIRVLPKEDGGIGFFAVCFERN